MKKIILLSIIFAVSMGVHAQVIPNGDMEATQSSTWKGVNSSYTQKLEAHDANQKLLTLWPLSGSYMLRVGNTSSSVGLVFEKFAWSTRPDNFSFNAGYLPGNTSEMFGAVIIMTKWNGTARDTILNAFLHPNTPGQVLPWSAINVTLTSLYKSAAMPDSCLIEFINDISVNTSGQLIATTATVLVIDDVKFATQTQSGQGFTSIENNDLVINNFYFANGSLNLNYTSKIDISNAKLAIYNLNGQVVYNKDLRMDNLGTNNANISVPGLKPGLYILSLTTNSAVVTKKFVVE